jgi:hypothetical protein
VESNSGIDVVEVVEPPGDAGSLARSTTINAKNQIWKVQQIHVQTINTPTRVSSTILENWLAIEQT